MKSPILLTALLALTINSAFAQSGWTDFSSALYKPDIEKMEKTAGIVADPAESVQDRFMVLKEFAISKLNYSPTLASSIPIQMMSLEEKILGKYTPPDEARIQDALTTSQPQTPAKAVKKRGIGKSIIRGLCFTPLMPVMAPIGLATGAVELAKPGSTPALTSTPYVINGGMSGIGTITTTPGGTILINGTGLH